jgi:hypothetical protein
MRPERLKQAVHHFERRWPRAKRQLRGPTEFFEVIRVVVNRDRILKWTHSFERGGELWAELVKTIKPKCPKHWKWETEERKVWYDDLSASYVAEAKVRFFRPE